MWSRRIAWFLTWVTICLAPLRAALGGQPITVALTLTERKEAGPEEQLCENLLSLMDLAVQADKSLAVVERRQIDLIIQEHLLDRSQRADPQLQLGKLLTADYLAMLETIGPEQGSPKPWGRLRVVDAKTAAIRGVTVAAIDEATLEETAEQFGRYVSAVIRAPNQPTITVAVAPLESKGRFERLRPLELGLRDLITARLLVLSGAASPGATSPGAAGGRPEKPPGQAPQFQVLQRSSMEQLLAELDLIRSGFSDKSRLPKTLPARSAAYLIRGEIDERQASDRYTTVVRGELVSARTKQVVERFEFESAPAELTVQLMPQVDRLYEKLCELNRLTPSRKPREAVEVESLKQLALGDLGRFRRNFPGDGTVEWFQLPNRPPIPRPIDANSSLGRYVIRKSIDRLESILYITPDDGEAGYTLAFCHALGDPEFYDPGRADQLLRNVYQLDPESELAACALLLLAQVGYDDRSSKLDPAQRAAAVDRAWFAFEHIPAKYRNHRWPWLLKLARQALDRPEDVARRADLLAMAAPYAEDPKTAFRDQVAQWVQGIAFGLSEQKSASPALRAKGSELLERWANGKDEQLAILGRRGLAQRLGDPRGSLDAAMAYEAAARKIVDLESQKNRDQRDAQIILAARNYRLAGHADRARDLLESFEVVLPPNSANVAGTNTAGEHDYELGVAYQTLGQHDKAMQVYLRAIERNPTVVIFSGVGSDLLKRIEIMGGIPLRKDRPVDVRYFPHDLATSRPPARPFGTVTMFLASDGQKIYLGGLGGLFAFDLASETWQKTMPPELVVTCLAYSRGQLWVGTDADGLWRREVATGNWKQIAADRLPDRHVEALTIHGPDVYAAVGTQASGGLIRIDSTERIHLFDQPSAPPQAPTHVVVTDKFLLARTQHRIHQWSFESHSWQVFDVGLNPPGLFLGSTGVWCSTGTRELTRWGDTPGENARFKAAWYLPENNQGYVMSITKLGYGVSFVSERGDQVWFGGTPYVPFVSTGLYRFDMKTGQFYKFGPADGFKAMQNWHCVHAGQWIANRLWLATDAGLCRVTPREVGNAFASPPAR